MTVFGRRSGRRRETRTRSTPSPTTYSSTTRTPVFTPEKTVTDLRLRRWSLTVGEGTKLPQPVSSHLVREGSGVSTHYHPPPAGHQEGTSNLHHRSVSSDCTWATPYPWALGPRTPWPDGSHRPSEPTGRGTAGARRGRPSPVNTRTL